MRCILKNSFSPSGGSSNGSGDTETCSEDGGEEGEESGIAQHEEGLITTREEGLVATMEEGMLVSKEKLVREKGYLINEGSPPYYRGARGMQNQVTCVK